MACFSSIVIFFALQEAPAFRVDVGQVEMVFNGSFAMHTMVASSMQGRLKSNGSKAANQTNFSGHPPYDATGTNVKAHAEAEHDHITALLEKSEVAEVSMQKRIASQAFSNFKLDAKSRTLGPSGVVEYKRTGYEFSQGGLNLVEPVVNAADGSKAFLFKHVEETGGGAEIEALSAVSRKCPGIVEIVEINPHVDGKQYFGQILEIMEGTAKSWVRNVDQSRRLQAFPDFVKSVLSGLLCLRQEGFRHTNLELDYVLYTDPKQLIWKVGGHDFIQPMSNRKAFLSGLNGLVIRREDEEFFTAGMTFMIFVLGRGYTETSLNELDAFSVKGIYDAFSVKLQSASDPSALAPVAKLVEKLVYEENRFHAAMEYMGLNISDFPYEDWIPPPPSNDPNMPSVPPLPGLDTLYGLKSSNWERSMHDGA